MSSQVSKNICSAIDCLSFNGSYLPPPLPVVHMTDMDGFKEIIETGVINPSDCEILQDTVSFLHYGVPVYRYKKKYKKRFFPAAIMFTPAIISESKSFMPYDSGATQLDVYHEDWVNRLNDFVDFRGQLQGRDAADLLQKFVCKLYGDNYKYIYGDCGTDCDDPPTPLDELCRFYNVEDEADSRRAAIELHYDKPIKLDEHIMWIALPQDWELETHNQLYETLGKTYPVLLPYDRTNRFDGTTAMCEKIADQARSFLTSSCSYLFPTKGD